MSEISFGNIILANNGKKGILKPDSEGFYRLNGGGFNIPNRNGVSYLANSYIQECMGEDSDLNRRVLRGEVMGEMGHPPMHYLENINGQIVRTKITNVFEWIQRLRTIDMDRVCMLIKKIIFNTDQWKGGNTGAIYYDILVKPFGPFGAYFEDHIKTPSANTAVSIRTVIKPTTFGGTTREVEYWTGNDWVVEPGMDWANKHMSAGCESFLNDYFKVYSEADLNVFNIDKDKAIQVMEAEFDKLGALSELAGTESYIGLKTMIDVVKNSKSYSDKVLVARTSNSMSIF